jgi:hypothetical protein
MGNGYLTTFGVWSEETGSEYCFELSTYVDVQCIHHFFAIDDDVLEIGCVYEVQSIERIGLIKGAMPIPKNQ